MTKNIYLSNINVYKILLGNIFAQSLPFLVSPLLSRLFSPSDYALLGLMLASSNVLFEIYTLKYDRTILIEPNRYVSINLLYLCLMLSFLMMIFFISIFSFTHFFSHIKNIHNQIHLLSLILPVITYAMSSVMAINNWFQKNNNYNVVVLIKIIQMLLITITSLFFGYIKLNNGLVIAYTIGWLLTFLFYMYYFYQYNFGFRFLNYELLFNGLKKYKAYPIFNTIPSMLYIIAISLPFYIIPYYFGEESSGYFNFCKQIILVPLGFVGGSFAQVYLKKFADNRNYNKPIFYILFKNMLLPILFIFFIVNFVIMLYGKELFSIVFGDKWIYAGVISEIYVLSATTQMIALALSSVFPALNAIKLESIFKIFYFVLILIALVFIPHQNIFEFVTYYTSIEVFYFTIYSLVSIFMTIKFDKTLNVDAKN